MSLAGLATDTRGDAERRGQVADPGPFGMPRSDGGLQSETLGHLRGDRVSVCRR